METERALRWVLLVLAALTPAVGLRLSGDLLWVVVGSGTALAAALAVWLLHRDGMLRGVLRREGLDLLVGLVVGGLLMYLVRLPLDRWIAPFDARNLSLRLCTLHGVAVPRPGAGFAHDLGEWLRGALCEGFARSGSLRGGARTAAVVSIALCEELAWRGGVQQALAERFGSTRGWLLGALAYGVAHAASGNVPLGLLALVCGLAWGALYRYRGRLVSSLVSHAIFSHLVFGASMPVAIVRSVS